MLTALARFIHGVIAAEGLIRTVCVDLKLDWEDATLIREAVKAGALIDSIEAHMQVPINTDGIEVFRKQPRSSPYCGAVTWYPTFTAEDSMWKWHHIADSCTRVNEVVEVLENFEMHLGGELEQHPRGSYCAYALMRKLSSGRRPLTGELFILEQSHMLYEKTYVGLHAWTAPFLKSTMGDRVPASAQDIKDPEVSDITMSPSICKP